METLKSDHLVPCRSVIIQVSMKLRIDSSEHLHHRFLHCSVMFEIDSLAVASYYSSPIRFRRLSWGFLYIYFPCCCDPIVALYRRLLTIPDLETKLQWSVLSLRLCATFPNVHPTFITASMSEVEIVSSEINTTELSSLDGIGPSDDADNSQSKAQDNPVRSQLKNYNYPLNPPQRFEPIQYEPVQYDTSKAGKREVDPILWGKKLRTRITSHQNRMMTTRVFQAPMD